MKWVSRKWIAMIVGVVAGIVVMVGGAQGKDVDPAVVQTTLTNIVDAVEVVVGGIVMLGSILGFIKAEGAIDNTRVEKNGE